MSLYQPSQLVGPSCDAPFDIPPRRKWRDCSVGLKKAWLATQVSHRGRYSIERLLALNEYTRKTSWTRVILVCVGTPLPVIALVLAQESVPLQKPSDGWRVNYGIWVRTGMIAAVISRTLVIQLKYLVEGATISSRQVALVVAAVTLCHVGQCLAIAANIVFPIPFMSISTTPTFFLILLVSFWLAVGNRVVRQIIRHRQQLFRFILFLSSQTLMFVAYPAYQTLFQAAADAGYDLFVVALLPVVKLVMKNIVAFSFRRIDDMMPEAVIFSVDFFNAFYIATSMQHASSLTTVVVIVVTDLIITALTLNGLRHGTSNTMKQLCATRASNGDDKRSFDLIEAACCLCRHHAQFELQDRARIQLRSCFPCPLSSENRSLLDHLDRYRGYRPHTRSLCYASNVPFILVSPPISTLLPSKRARWRCNTRPSTTAAVQPITVKRVDQAGQQKEKTQPYNSIGQSKLLGQALEILFTSECLVLAEYLESVVPILYASYIMVMVHLPSALYHSEMAGITIENVTEKIQTVFGYAALEFVSFAALAIIMQRSCGIRSLYHLAFVLETHMPLIQDKLISWTLLTLASRVVHFGVDFTFHFAWV